MSEGRGLSRSYPGSCRRGVWSRPGRSRPRNLCNPPRRCRARRCRARSKVVATASVHLGAFAGEDLVVAAPLFVGVAAPPPFKVVAPASTLEVVVPVGPEERIVAGGDGENLRQGFVCGEERGSDHTTITVS